ncbi:GNAT family N-acetyltransferase [Streptomyces sp. NPDC096012]|uniref:GNAT family N-acetyltransferase n=1 Tax=Streptomyces sp. NPDC096012 TaxID=3155684 RepID=UPI00336A009F
MSAVLHPARVQDIAELRQLYFEVYGHGYPVPLGSDPAVMRRLITDGTAHWLTARTGGVLVGSAVVLTEPGSRIGKLVGLAVHPGHRGGGLASRLTGAVCDEAFATGRLDSVYATVRVVTEGPQHVVVRNGFRPLGLLPNAVEVDGCETLALFARYADGVLAHRAPVAHVPERLSALLSAAGRGVGIDYSGVDHTDAPDAPCLLPDRQVHTDVGAGGADVAVEADGADRAVGADGADRADVPVGADRAGGQIELIAAPAFVRRRFLELFPRADARFFPLHTPNAVLVAGDGRFEAYADLDPVAGSCALVAVHPCPAAVAGALETLIATVTRAGADYVEALLPLADAEALRVFLDSGFVPSALYPAMRRVPETGHDPVGDLDRDQCGEPGSPRGRAPCHDRGGAPGRPPGGDLDRDQCGEPGRLPGGDLDPNQCDEPGSPRGRTPGHDRGGAPGRPRAEDLGRDRFHDYVVLSRTSRQIDFRSAAVSPLLQPYLGAYLSAWTATYLPLPEVSR